MSTENDALNWARVYYAERVLLQLGLLNLKPRVGPKQLCSVVGSVVSALVRQGVLLGPSLVLWEAFAALLIRQGNYSVR